MTLVCVSGFYIRPTVVQTVTLSPTSFFSIFFSELSFVSPRAFFEPGNLASEPKC